MPCAITRRIALEEGILLGTQQDAIKAIAIKGSF
jgi:hypothetical protein